MRQICFFILLISFSAAFGQQRSGTITGKITGIDELPIADVRIKLVSRKVETSTNDSGKYSIQIPAGRFYAITFDHPDYFPQQRNVYLQNSESEVINIRLSEKTKSLENVVIQNEGDRKETGLIKLTGEQALLIPSSTGGVEALIKTMVGSNNELTSGYNVRGGNFDENLVYINGYEVYRPYLVSNGQQEGLSLINPSLTGKVEFYNGGFQAKFGDKLSSVLDIYYKRPKQSGGSVYISLLEQGAHLEGTKNKGKFTYLIGARNKTNNSILGSQATSGSYLPSASDVQALLQYKFSEKNSLEYFGIYSTSRFTFFPEEVKKTAAVFSPLYSAAIGIDVFFEGSEKDRYKTMLNGLSLIQKPDKDLMLKWQLSAFTNKEGENFDIGGQYRFGSRELQAGGGNSGEISNVLGAGYYQNYGRNSLNIQNLTAGHKGELSKVNHYLVWGLQYDRTNISDHISEFDYKDSAGFSLPYVPGELFIERSVQSAAKIAVNKYSAYLQDNIKLGQENNMFLTLGARVNYNDLNREALFSPRMQLSWQPGHSNNLILKASAGLYAQPPFYRELRDRNGNLNINIKSQKSKQVTLGADYRFTSLNNKPFRLLVETYFKSLSDVIPYDVENVKIRYWGANMAKAYAGGIDLRLFGELSPGAQSWVSLGYMRSRENIENDFYTKYVNASGEEINSTTTDKVIADSSLISVGYVRRPNDRMLTGGLYIEDYLTTNENFKLHVNLLYGSNMPYNVPGSTRYRNALKIEPYLRADLGFSVLLLNENTVRRSYSPLRNFENIWLSLEVLNAINRYNTISYQLVMDMHNNVFALPNRLTPRLINLKLLARF